MATDALWHGAYICVSAAPEAHPSLAALPVERLAQRLGLRNEFFAGDGHPDATVAFLGRLEVRPGTLADEALLHAGAIVHVASADAHVVATFSGELERLLSPLADAHVLTGSVRPTQYTGGAMHEFAYAGQLKQHSGEAMPNAFLLPLRKLPDWWAKNWMERHTYFLPRYDAAGVMTHEGHALAAAPGIGSLMRRTYRCEDAPASESAYDFLTYFECADANVTVFHAVCAALRDVQRNPEWQFVREGPTWHGRRVPSWRELFARV